MTKHSSKRKQFITEPVEVDLSVRIEQLQRDTVIGIGGEKTSHGFVLPRKLKRSFNERFRRIGQPRLCAPTLFGAAVVAALQASGRIPSQVTIDREYDGYESLIIGLLALFFPRAIVVIKPIGRKSPAHAVAYNTHLRHRSPDGKLSQRHLAKIITGALNKKTAREPHRPGLAGVRKPNWPVRGKYKRG